MLPTFLGLGAQRAGTTWIHQCLAEHPQVCMPSPRKETHFFDSRFDEGLDWYAQRFVCSGERAREVRAVGEVCPNYLDHPEAVDRIARTLPEVKLFVVLRDPAERARSAYRMFQQHYPGISLLGACRAGTELVRCGLYAEHLERVFDRFPRERVRIWLYEQLESHPAALVRELYEFVGVEANFVPPSLNLRYNRPVYPRLQALARQCGMDWAIRAVKRSPVGDWVRRRQANPVAARCSDSAGDSLEMESLRAIFRDDVVRLQRMIDQDVSPWLPQETTQERRGAA